MHLNRRDYDSYYAPSVPFFWRVAIGVFIAAVVVIIIRSILQAASAKRARQNAATASNNPIYYNPQNNYYQQSPMNTTNGPPRNQPQNPEDVIEPLPVYTPPNNSTDKPPNYYN
ncbi:hypothetical protein CONCODRAFT_78843, partial [Conidiobolus coronatus NRRL 28638]